MEKELLTKYVEYLEKRDSNIKDIDTYIKAIESNPKFYSIIKSINSVKTKEEKIDIINAYYSQEQIKAKANDEQLVKETCSKMFGVSFSNIEHLKLNSGIDILAFYDSKLGRKRLIDYSFAKNLAIEFATKQMSSSGFQSDDYYKNSFLIAENEAYANNSKRELNMVDINRAFSEYDNFIKRIPNLDSKKLQAINEIIKSRDSKKIKYINFENMIALDEKGNIIESFYNEKTEKVEFETPEKYNPNVDYIEIGENNEVDSMKENSIDSIQSNNSDYEYEEQIVSPESIKLDEEINRCKIIGDSKNIFENIKKYSNDMSRLDYDYQKGYITNDEFEFYEMMSNKYNNLLKNKNLVYKNTKGLISILLISLIVIIVSLMILFLY